MLKAISFPKRLCRSLSLYKILNVRYYTFKEIVKVHTVREKVNYTGCPFFDPNHWGLILTLSKEVVKQVLYFNLILLCNLLGKKLNGHNFHGLMCRLYFEGVYC